MAALRATAADMWNGVGGIEGEPVNAGADAGPDLDRTRENAGVIRIALDDAYVSRTRHRTDRGQCDHPSINGNPASAIAEKLDTNAEPSPVRERL